MARLADYRLRFPLASRRWGGGVADIFPMPGDEVWGGLWLIATTDSPALDAQEGVHHKPPRYFREQVEVEVPAGDRVNCLIYRVTASAAVDTDLGPSVTYRDTMLRGAYSFQLPAAYVARIEELSIVEA